MFGANSGGFMCGANMSIARCEVVKYFATGCIGECALRNTFVMCLEMTIEIGFICETLITVRALVQFVACMKVTCMIKLA